METYILRALDTDYGFDKTWESTDLDALKSFCLALRMDYGSDCAYIYRKSDNVILDF